MDDLAINRRLTIPGRELRVEVSTASGPGGQHVNRARTRVTLVFDVEGSPTLGEVRRRVLMNRLGTRLERDGTIRMTSGRSRRQQDNLRAVRSRLAELLREALVPQRVRRPTTPTRASRVKRLDSKSRAGMKKRERGRNWRDSG